MGGRVFTQCEMLVRAIILILQDDPQRMIQHYALDAGDPEGPAYINVDTPGGRYYIKIERAPERYQPHA